MKRNAAMPVWLLLAWFMGCIAGCGEPAKPPAMPATPENATTDSGKQNSVGVEFKGVDLRLFNTEPTQTSARKPRFWLHADKQTITAEGVTSFEKAHAVVYGKETDEEQLTLDAGAGQYKEDEMVYLSNEVVARAGEVTIRAQDMTYENNSKVAKSDNPVSIDSPKMQLKAASVRILPDTREMELGQGSGTIPIGELMK